MPIARSSGVLLRGKPRQFGEGSKRLREIRGGGHRSEAVCLLGGQYIQELRVAGLGVAAILQFLDGAVNAQQIAGEENVVGVVRTSRRLGWGLGAARRPGKGLMGGRRDCRRSASGESHGTDDRCRKQPSKTWGKKHERRPQRGSTGRMGFKDQTRPELSCGVGACLRS